MTTHTRYRLTVTATNATLQALLRQFIPTNGLTLAEARAKKRAVAELFGDAAAVEIGSFTRRVEQSARRV